MIDLEVSGFLVKQEAYEEEVFYTRDIPYDTSILTPPMTLLESLE